MSVTCIETFRATKRKVTDKKEAAEICGCDVEDNFDHILVYCESLYIDGYDDGSYFLHIANRSYGKPLEELEVILFDWAKYEGYVTPSLSDPVDKYIGQECPRCCKAVLEKSLCGNVICPNEDEGAFEGGRCGFSTEGLDDEEGTPSPALSLDEKVKLVVAETSDKFGEALVKHFPEIKSGDFLMQSELDEIVEQCTRHWVEMNKDSWVEVNEAGE